MAFATPTPPPSLNDLGEIGRVKSVSPACSVMRDLAIPAVNAALKADQYMLRATPKLSTYARSLAEGKGGHFEHGVDPFQGRPTETPVDTTGQTTVSLSQVSQAATAMLQNTKIIADALGDPRLSPSNPDPQIQAQRQALEALYYDQETRALALWKFETTQRNDRKNDLDIDKNSGGAGLPIPIPRATQTLPDMPRLLGIPLQDENSMRTWTTSVNQGIRRGEELAAQTLLPILQGCLDDGPITSPAPK